LPIFVTIGILAGLLFLLLTKEQGVAIEKYGVYHFVEIKEYLQMNIINFDEGALIRCIFCGEQIDWIIV